MEKSNGKAATRKAKYYLEYRFSEDELKGFSKELAREAANVSEQEEKKKAAVASFADDIASSKARVSSLARKINSGYEMRDIECEVRLDSPSTGFATIIRLDTGETVRTRPMEPDELQFVLEI